MNAEKRTKQMMHYPASHNLTRQAGFGLIEIGIALVIMGAMVAGVLAMMNSTNLSQKTTQLRTDLVGLKSAVSQIGYQSGNFGNASLNGILVRSGKLPTTLRTSGTDTISHQFDDDITVMGRNTRFYVQLNNMPQDACISMVTGDMGWDYVGSGATAPTEANMITPPAGNRPPLDPVQIDALCGAATQNLYFGGR
jgi:type II secretory pathway pseudopilin PulG